MCCKGSKKIKKQAEKNINRKLKGNQKRNTKYESVPENDTILHLFSLL